MKEKIKKLYAKFERGFAELLEFPFKGILNSFILAIAVILVILLIAAMGRSFGAAMPQTNNIPISKTAAKSVHTVNTDISKMIEPDNLKKLRGEFTMAKKEKITDIKQCPDLNPFKNLTPREKMLLNMYDFEFGREFLIKKIKKNSFIAVETAVIAEAFSGIIPEGAKIEVDTSPAGRTFRNGEIYAVFFVDDESHVDFRLKRIFLVGEDIILSEDMKRDYSTLRLKDTKPEDVILGRLTAVNGKPLR